MLCIVVVADANEEAVATIAVVDGTEREDVDGCDALGLDLNCLAGLDEESQSSAFSLASFMATTAARSLLNLTKFGLEAQFAFVQPYRPHPWVS